MDGWDWCGVWSAVFWDVVLDFGDVTSKFGYITSKLIA
jgi:hypothetical protein